MKPTRTPVPLLRAIALSAAVIAPLAAVGPVAHASANDTELKSMQDLKRDRIGTQPRSFDRERYMRRRFKPVQPRYGRVQAPRGQGQAEEKKPNLVGGPGPACGFGGTVC